MTEKKRIAWILYGSLDLKTGGTIYDAHIVEGLRADGDDVEVIAFPFPSSKVKNSKRAFDLVRRLARMRPDAIVGDELCFRELAFVFSRTTFTRRVLLVHHLTCWEEELHKNAREHARLWESTALRQSDVVIATSNTTKTRLVHEGYAKRIDVVLPGADRLPSIAQREELEPKPRSPHTRFLFIGTLIARKRVRELVDAFLTIDGSTELRLAGGRDRDPGYVREIDRVVAASSKKEDITFLGELDARALAQEIANADVLVMPSSLEGYGIAATEAIRAGTPVIAAHTSGLIEALAPCPDAVTFFHVEGGGARALASTMQRVANDRDLLTSMKHAAKLASSGMPTWSNAARAFRALL